MTWPKIWYSYDSTLRSLGEGLLLLAFSSQVLNGVEEGKAWMGEGGRAEEVASSKNKNRIED